MHDFTLEADNLRECGNQRLLMLFLLFEAELAESLDVSQLFVSSSLAVGLRKLRFHSFLSQCYVARTQGDAR